MTKWTIAFPPVEGGRTIVIDEVNLIVFLKKNGCVRAIDHIQVMDGSDVLTVQGNSGGFYKIRQALVSFDGIKGETK
tara:strand:- start:430 stop:660 length:231 start_codon:yes stop_codon:yes gene_type:complete